METANENPGINRRGDPRFRHRVTGCENSNGQIIRCLISIMYLRRRTAVSIMNFKQDIKESGISPRHRAPPVYLSIFHNRPSEFLAFNGYSCQLLNERFLNGHSRDSFHPEIPAG